MRQNVIWCDKSCCLIETNINTRTSMGDFTTSLTSAFCMVMSTTARQPLSRSFVRNPCNATQQRHTSSQFHISSLIAGQNLRAGTKRAGKRPERCSCFLAVVLTLIWECLRWVSFPMKRRQTELAIQQGTLADACLLDMNWCLQGSGYGCRLCLW